MEDLSRRLVRHKVAPEAIKVLLSKASETDLTPPESAKLHQLTKEYEDGMIMKAEALRVLSTLGEDITPYVGIPENA
jgi:hypothetical protein